MMGYTVPPNVTSGDTWDLDDFNTYVVDNITALYALLSESAATLSLGTDYVVVGSDDDTIQGLQLGTGDLVVGSASGVTTLGPGSNGQILGVVSGVPAYFDLELPLSLIYALAGGTK